MIRPLKVGHLVLKVTDLDAATAFYTGKLGFEIVNHLDRPPMVFLSLGVQHHDLALVQVGGTDRETVDCQPGLHHFALQLENESALRAAHAYLTQHNVPVLRAVDHGTTHSIYFRDPAGNRIELYCDINASGLERARRRTIRDVNDFPLLDLT